MSEILIQEFEKELTGMLNYWATYTVDKVHTGFYGQVDNDNNAIEKADKGVVLNSRILWFFSAAYNYKSWPESLHLARRSYDYIRDHFVDKQFGGVYWSVDFQGKPADTKKQMYALAFALYGITEFYKASKEEEALALAKILYADIEKHSFDPINNGYVEAFSCQWSELTDQRLSDKDANEKKTMNTHLHVLEAYTSLYTVWPDEGLGRQIRNLLGVFTDKIIDRDTHHLMLFFDESWHSKSRAISFGHDIEASWLLLEAAESLGDENMIWQFKDVAVKMAMASIQGLDENGGLNYEFEPSNWSREKHWWVQAEAMVGFFNAFQLTKEQTYYDKFLKCWEFTKAHIIDTQKGEWFWGVNEDLSLMPEQYKVGLWKCPYHNGRACLEMIRRLGVNFDFS
ncbi:mannobiose 2-epimerase [Pedobacter sp. AK017]|uniref:AGE family epimerase/isomerase n=1 Tax=Pedobacter sp. AK017 TaxID=2723073 RepID=UPI001610B963|nr:AGE family epimerase/isomerase [Pedobacter sp. AK017]MBB5439695.1 mannobiose 2-epimerase [Pedobacter sp. AK017]